MVLYWQLAVSNWRLSDNVVRSTTVVLMFLSVGGYHQESLFQVESCCIKNRAVSGNGCSLCCPSYAGSCLI